MPELFRALQVKGEPIAVAISRSCVVVAGSEEPAALDAMAAFVAGRLPQETRPTSFLPLVLKDDDWQAIDPYSHPVDALRDLAIKQAVWDYGIQAGELEAYFEAQGIDVFVAPLESGRFRGDAHTWTSWTEGVPALLPRSEAVGLTSLDGRSLFRSWRDIEEVCGAFKPDTTLHPVRYRPPPWPSTEMWKQVEAHLEPPGWTPSDSELAHESGQIAAAPQAS